MRYKLTIRHSTSRSSAFGAIALNQISGLHMDKTIIYRLDKTLFAYMDENEMGEIIDFRTKESERRLERIQELMHKALTDLLDDEDMQELKKLTRQGCH